MRMTHGNTGAQPHKPGEPFVIIVKDPHDGQLLGMGEADPAITGSTRSAWAWAWSYARAHRHCDVSITRGTYRGPKVPLPAPLGPVH